MSLRNKKPSEKAWRTSRLYRVHLFDQRWPVAGFRMIFAVVGHKWVRCVTPITNIKFKMSRADWDALQVCEEV